MSWTIAIIILLSFVNFTLVILLMKKKQIPLDQRPELRLKMLLRYQPFSADKSLREFTSSTLEAASLVYDSDGLVHFPDLNIVLPAKELSISISIVDLNAPKKYKRAL